MTGTHKQRILDRKNITLPWKASLSSPSSSDTMLEMEDLEPVRTGVKKKKLVLYREGFYESDEGQWTPINTICTRSLTPIDIEGGSDILTSASQLSHILSRAPQRYQCMKWKCFYSLLKDGCSMQTFYDRTMEQDINVLIVQDAQNNIFGAYVDAKLKAKHPQRYDGSNECFVYKFTFDIQNRTYSIFEYHAPACPAKAKPYFVQSDDEGITIGAGECPAIYIQNNLLEGSSTESQTFNSEPLCAPT
eukprot:CAMPEP_0202691512 /NCGR_PEP_ID=MMETSP1385-20130828/6211_1 /ASSEMBLY_ACC=CAM_ASM_000861 /TAXON_ID=933848 /ORGANISM="Elphidium margaritaceum" /LENGTH=246 /DNA_ID=CAMNT_0049346933 /DNA_START=132 /DNA_END=868 /DNA_ORIENTATION=+